MYNTADFFASHPVFTAAEFSDCFRDRNQRAKQNLLDYHVNTGSIIRVRRGLFATVPMYANAESFKVNSLLVASKVADDSVIAYHSALTYHGLAHSVRHVITFQTKHKDTKPFTFQGNNYRPVSPDRGLLSQKKENIFVDVVDLHGLQIQVTSIERTLVDCLNRIVLAGGMEEVWRSLEGLTYINTSRLMNYLVLLNNSTLAAKVGYFLDTNKERLTISSDTLDKLRGLCPQFPCYMFRSKRDGQLIKEWNLIVPEAIIQKNWEEQF